ncbi:MAG TPA: hypothetical protein VN969_24705 [Streptosporangiaceae bacterium]|nr:hypothetical protein [Streptosporangiaceae bacterium]
MSSWINLSAIWRIVVVGLLAGAGLPALVAVGLRALSPRAAGSSTATGSGTAAGSGTVTAGENPAGVTVAVLCFTVVLAAIGYGIYLIVAGGH